MFTSSVSRLAIPLFIRKAKIDMTQFMPGPYRSFNEFFIRQIRPKARPIDKTPEHVISPCDAKAAAYPVTRGSVWHVKEQIIRWPPYWGARSWLRAMRAALASFCV